jgi:hypothetical protein
MARTLFEETLVADPARGGSFARVFPCLGWEALKRDAVVPYITWCALGAIDREGTGRLTLDVACDLIEDWRGVARSSARRLLRSGPEHCLWHLASDHVQLTGVARLLVVHGLERERAPHLVRLSDLVKPAQMKAHLFATVYEIPGHSQRFHNAPLSREVKERITGVPPSTQRRYDHWVTELVQPTYLRIDRGEDSGIVLEGDGYFSGRDGSQIRRGADYRVPRGHLRLSRSAAAHATAKARALREVTEGRGSGCLPLANSRGSSPDPDPPPTRRFYSGNSEASARNRAGSMAWQPSERAVFGWGLAGEMEFSALEPPL